jgi:hypothetical protein
MKSICRIAIIALFTHLANVTVAQSKLNEKQKQELKAKFESYKTKLNLTEDQQQKVGEVNTVYFEGLAEIRASGNSRLSKLKTFRNLSEKKDKQMKQILDKNQYEIYKNMQTEMKQEFKNKRGRG